MYGKNWISFRTGVCNKFQDTVAKSRFKSLFSMKEPRRSVGQSRARCRLLNEVRSGYNQRHAGGMCCVRSCEECWKEGFALWFLPWSSPFIPVARSGQWSEWERVPPFMRPSASLVARHPQWFFSSEKNKDYAYGLLLLSVHACRALYLLTIKILRQELKYLHRGGVHTIACSV